MAVYPERRSRRFSGKWIAEVTQQGERRTVNASTRSTSRAALCAAKSNNNGRTFSAFLKVRGGPLAPQEVLSEEDPVLSLTVTRVMVGAVAVFGIDETTC
jgi:hypothetical protein